MDEYTRLTAYADSLDAMLQAEWQKSPRTRTTPRLPSAFPKTNLAHPDLIIWVQMIERVLMQVVSENERWRLANEKN